MEENQYFQESYYRFENWDGNSQLFYEKGLGYFVPLQNPLHNNSSLIGLPGIGEYNTQKCKDFGLNSACAIFGQYLALGRNKEVFLDYLENYVGVKFVDTKFYSADVYKNLLCYVLESKWNKVKEF